MKWVLVLLFFIATQAQARVFDFYNQSFATYFKGTYGMSEASQQAYGDSSGGSTFFNSKESVNYGGEVGFIFPNKFFAWRLAFQMIAPQSMHGIPGNSASGGNYMDVSSTLYGFFPMAYFEYYAFKGPSSRALISVGGGYGKVIMKNTYNMTAAGTTQYGLNSFSEQASQLTYIADASLGYEYNFAQNTTLAIDAGYHYCIAGKLTYDNGITDFTGAHAQGATVLNDNGTNKKINLSGGYVGLAFRFYFNY